MIQFFVKNKEVVLPDDYSFMIIDENPEITSDGVFTLDITSSLLEAKNAIAFEFLNRLNKETITKTAEAYLIDDGSVRNGMIIISSNDEVSVTYQFIAGNSELKYIAKNEKKIWQLDWGEETAIDFNRALASINSPGYGDMNFICTPVALDSIVANKFTVSAYNDANPFQINGVDNIIMQPYLLYYINKLPELLGYTLVSNILNDDERAKKMYIINSVNTLKYADALPDWTITEFKEEVENIFNVSFIVDPASKSISIESLSSSITNKKIVNPIVLDSYGRDLNQNSKSLKINFTKISYYLNSNKFFNWHNLSENILLNYKVMDFINLDSLKSWVADNTSNIGIPLNTFLRDVEKDDYYIHVTSNKPSASLYTLPITYQGDFDFLRNIQLIDKFSSIGNDATRELKFKIVPGEFLKSYQTITISNGTVNAYFQCPKSTNQYYVPQTKTLIEAVEGSEVNIPRLDKLEVALYTGKIKPWFEHGSVEVLWPFSHIDCLPEFSPSGADIWMLLDYKTWVETYFIPAATKTLKLKGDDGIVDDYHQETIIDTSMEFTFTILDSPDVKATNIFIINNLKYLPISLERQKTKNQKAVTGKFYKML